MNGLNGAAFHYSIYCSLTRFLGMDGNLEVEYDVSTNFVTAWNEIFVDNDLPPSPIHTYYTCRVFSIPLARLFKLLS